MPKVILFDFDGTIADTFENFLVIADKLSEKYNFPKITEDEITRLRAEDVRTLLRIFKIPIHKLPFIARDLKKMQNQMITDVKPFKGIPSIIHELKKEGFKLGVLSSNSNENITTFNKEFGLDVFDYVFTDIGMFGKARAISKFIKNNNLNKNDVIYVGDEIRDIKACKIACVKIISVVWGFNSIEGLKRYSPDFLCETPDEILKIIKTNFNSLNNT